MQTGTNPLRLVLTQRNPRKNVNPIRKLAQAWLGWNQTVNAHVVFLHLCTAGESVTSSAASRKKKARHKYKPQTVKGKLKGSVTEGSAASSAKQLRKGSSKSPAVRLAKPQTTPRPPPQSRVSPGIVEQNDVKSALVAENLFGPMPGSSMEFGLSLHPSSVPVGASNVADRSLAHNSSDVHASSTQT